MNYNFLDRFGSHIECGPEIDSCWTWTSAHNGFGYGQISINDKTYLSHRISYQLYKGSIPDGLELDHLCSNNMCVNPDHLEPVTHTENMRRSAINKKPTTHCKQGHEYTKENTYNSPNTVSKTCIICRKESSKKLRESYKI